MKKILYSFLVCLVVTACIVSGQRSLKAEKKRKKRAPVSEQVQMRLPGSLPIENLRGQNREKMVELIRSFPTASYQLFSVPANGYFYIDQVEDHIKGHLTRGGTWEKHIQEVIKHYTRPGSIVLDIGAHIGTHTLVMAQAVGPQGQVLAFEPQPKICRELFMNMGINGAHNVFFYWAGVGNQEGHIELSPLSLKNEGGTGLCGGSGEVVELMTIDSLKLSDVSLIKIDVEGMEEAVLDGARETILANRPVIIIEIMGGNDFGDATREVRQKILHTIDQIEGMGYRVTQLWRHDWLAVPI